MVVIHLTADVLEEEGDKFEGMISIVSKLFSQKLLYGNKTDELGLFVSSDGQLRELVPFSKISCQHLRLLKEFYTYPNKAGTISLLDSLQQAGNLFKKHYEKKKFQKKLFLLSTGASCGFEKKIGLEELAYFFGVNDIRVNVISFGFWVKRLGADETGRENREALKEVVENARGYVKVFDAQTAIKILNELTTKKVRSAVKFSGSLELGPKTKISVKVMAKSMKTNLPPAKLMAANNDQIVRERIAFAPDDPSMKPLPEEVLSRGFNYGSHIVPVTKQIESMMKFEEGKCLRMIGFVSESSLPPWMAMGPTDCIFADEAHINHVMAFNALVAGMVEAGSVMLARYTQRNAGAPKLVCLRPKKKETRDDGEVSLSYVLYMSEAPTAEDVREFAIGSVAKASAAEVKLAEELVEQMDIQRFQEGENEPEELVKPSETPNPTFQIFRQKLLERALMGEQYQSFQPEQVEPRVVDAAFAENRTHPRIADLEPELAEAFGLAEAVRPTEAPRLFWREIIAQRQPAKPKDDKDDSAPKDIGASHPISDFRDMLDYRKEDLVAKAVKQMQARILELVRVSVDGSLFDKALDCLAALRDGTIREGEADAYNAFLFKLKDNIGSLKNFREFWAVVRSREDAFVGLVTNEEAEESDVTPEQAQKFWAEFDPSSSRQNGFAKTNDGAIDELE